MAEKFRRTSDAALKHSAKLAALRATFVWGLGRIRENRKHLQRTPDLILNFNEAELVEMCEALAAGEEALLGGAP